MYILVYILYVYMYVHMNTYVCVHVSIMSVLDLELYTSCCVALSETFVRSTWRKQAAASEG